MPNGDGGGFDFGGLFSGILGLLTAIIQAIIDFLNALVRVLVGILNFLFAGEQAIFTFSFDGLGSILKVFKRIGDFIWKSIILKALNHILGIIHTLQRWARALKTWLDRFHRLMHQYQVAAFRRIINLIQRARKILLIFRILHLKFATKLDNWLAGIEGKIISRTSEMARKTNEIIFWLDLILDPVRGLSHLPIFLAGMKSADAILKIFTGHGLDFWYSKPVPGGVALPPPASAKQFYTELETDLRAGSGDVGAWRADLQGWLGRMKEIT